MNVQKKEFRNSTIRFLELPDNDLLLNTKDVLAVLAITDRPEGSDLAEPCLDLVSAVNMASGNNDDFAMWLNESFAAYNLETLVHPNCEDEWNFD